MNVAQALAQAASLGLDRLDAQLLLLHALGRSGTDRGWLLAHDTDGIAGAHEHAFAAACQRRAGGEPLAYIVGRKEFHGLDLQVDARVLVPRPDTETLVDWAIELLRAHEAPRVVDLGTGSGAIALALKKEIPGARVEACDTSADALAAAQANAHRLGLAVEFRLASWLDGAVGFYDLIASNPPYVAVGDAHLAALQHEPQPALVSGADGLDAIRAIVAQAPSHLGAGGWLLLEHGWDQAPAVRALLHAAGFGYVASRRDLAGIERCTGAKWLELG
ncbi:peptide chain release factor N(5)-glutamine methyltransferase [Ramlibacter sp. PS4R-6]|uniref:peptide chain release factor N(5)-glutamine methyltransferase n=1 Tax=Ramlibacter sp. PS4R-6 TaxID=3133438 RepID=UPI00309F16BA